MSNHINLIQQAGLFPTDTRHQLLTSAQLTHKHMSNDFEEVKRKSNYIKFNKINDHIQGTLTKVTVPTEPDMYGRMDKKYTILCESGQVYGGTMEKDTGNYIVDSAPTTLEPGREYIVTGKVSLDSSMAELKLGQRCIIQLYELKPSKKGSRPAKVMKVFKGTMNDEWLKDQANATFDTTPDVTPAGTPGF